MKFRSPPGQFHYEPPLLQTYFLAVCSMDYRSKKNGMSILDLRIISRKNLLIERMLSHLTKRFGSAMGYKMITSDQQIPFYCSWVYTFSATPRSLRTWAPVPPRETGCDRAPPAQLCWSSGSSFPHRLSDSIFGLLCTLIDQSRGNDSITLRFFRCPGIFAIAMVSFSSLKFLTFAK